MAEHTDLQVTDHERGRQDLDAVEATLGRLLAVMGEKRVVAALAQRARDPVQHLDDVGAGAAAGIEHNDARIGEAIGDAELRAQHLVNALDHVGDDLGRRVPDAERLAQLRVERLEEGLVEVLDRVRLLEGAEERSAINAIEGFRGPVEDLVELQSAELRWVGEVVEELLQDGDVQIARRRAPVEADAGVGAWVVFGREDPGGEEAVEQRLHQGRAEEVLALLTREAHAEGLFAAWVFWAEHHPRTDTGVRFDWRSAARYLHIPILQKLFYDFANPAQLGALKLDEVLDWAAEALNRVDRASFFSSFEQSHAVQYFYEPFLEAFDPELRKALGVWYTPPEIVTYMVERVDQVLRSELGIADGLADPRVVVLDPCCGTGAYLVEVLNRIASTLRERGDDALLAHDLKEAAKSRVYGFEILPAPFVISHLQIGMLLHRLGAPLSDESDERAGVYLTNALTGWEPPTEPKQHLLFTEMEEERDKAEHVKQHAPILVILGNPPYNGFAGVSPEEEGGLLDAYKAGLAEWGVTKHSLDDLYVRFFRIAERRIAEEGKRGVVCFISNDSWTAGPSYVTAREHLLASFDKFWIENMHGDRTQSEYAPDGRTSETVFALRGFSPGIRQGVAISLWVKSGRDEAITEVRFRDDLDDADAGARRQALLASLDDSKVGAHYLPVEPTAASRLSFRPYPVDAAYGSWPSVAELSADSWLLGLNENRGQALIDDDAGALADRMQTYFDSDVALAQLPESLDGLKHPWARFDPEHTRRALLNDSEFDPALVRRFLVRPFDEKWAYCETRAKLWNEARANLVRHAAPGAKYLLARCRAPKALDGSAFMISSCLADQHALHKDAYLIPMTLMSTPDDQAP